MKNKTYANFNELVFEDRNRNYGAYVLRKRYEDNLLIGMLLGISTVALAVGAPYIRNLFRGETTTIENTSTSIPLTVDQLDFPKDDIVLPKENKVPQEPQAPKETKAFLMPVVSSTTDTKIVAIEDLHDVAIGFKDIEGEKGGLYSIEEGPKGNGDMAKVEEKITYDFVAIELKPVYPGGESEMYKYIGETIRYPERAKDINVSGIVYVSFVIDEFGRVVDAKVERGIGSGCDEEALRVIKGMKRWKPGKQAGRPVRVKFHIPIQFQLQ